MSEMLICLQLHKLVSSVVSRMLTEDTRLQGQELGLSDSLQPRTRGPRPVPGTYTLPSPPPQSMGKECPAQALHTVAPRWGTQSPEQSTHQSCKRAANKPEQPLSRGEYCLSYPGQQTNLPFAQGRNGVFLPRQFTTKSPLKKITLEQKCRNV